MILVPKQLLDYSGGWYLTSSGFTNTNDSKVGSHYPISLIYRIKYACFPKIGVAGCGIDFGFGKNSHGISL